MGDLLTLAHDLADRLIIAFDKTPSGIPHPRVNLKHGLPQSDSGLPDHGYDQSCTAGAGSLVLGTILFTIYRFQFKHVLFDLKPVHFYLEIMERAVTIQVSFVDFRSILSEK